MHFQRIRFGVYLTDRSIFPFSYTLIIFQMKSVMELHHYLGSQSIRICKKRNLSFLIRMTLYKPRNGKNKQFPFTQDLGGNYCHRFMKFFQCTTFLGSKSDRNIPFLGIRRSTLFWSNNYFYSK